MKKETWKTVIQVIVAILTAALTALGTTSCMGHGPIALWRRNALTNEKAGSTHRSRCQFSFIPVCISYTHVWFVSKDLYFENYGEYGLLNFENYGKIGQINFEETEKSVVHKGHRPIPCGSLGVESLARVCAIVPAGISRANSSKHLSCLFHHTCFLFAKQRYGETFILPKLFNESANL